MLLRPLTWTNRVSLLLLAMGLFSLPCPGADPPTDTKSAENRASTENPPKAATTATVFAKENLVAWCIVPFDAKKRTPAERAQMLQELGIRRCAYDWRGEHVATFEEEIIQYQKHGIEFFAFWSTHPEALKLFAKYKLKPQFWVTLGSPNVPTQQERVDAAAQGMVHVVQEAAKIGSDVGLYNHGGWGGEPKNLVAVCKRLREMGHANVGIVYNFHHGHGHIADWEESFTLMQPYLLCLNLNGMNDNANPKILGIGKGNHEREMLRVVLAHGYTGPIGILDHREQLDARDSLQENLDGLEKLRQELQPATTATNPHEPRADSTGESIDTAMAHTHPVALLADTGPTTGSAPPYDQTRIAELLSKALTSGDTTRGAMVFASPKGACLSCHQVEQNGGVVGPALTKIGKERLPVNIVESVYWPKRCVKPEYIVWKVARTDGEVVSGYRIQGDDQQVVLKDPSTGKVTEIPRAEVEEEQAGTTPMPEGLTAWMSEQQQVDLIAFLCSLGRDEKPLQPELAVILAHAHSHGPAKFPFERPPLVPANWQFVDHPVNRDRMYDFYGKQAEYFRHQPLPMVLAPFPGLDGGKQGHWGNQNESTWSDDRWNRQDTHGLQCGVLHVTDKIHVPRAVCVRLGNTGGANELSACFNPDTLTYDAVWQGGFVRFSSVRHGFLDGLRIVGELLPKPEGSKPAQPFQYHGFYRYGKQILFAYRIGDVEYLDAPIAVEGQFVQLKAPVATHPLRNLIQGGTNPWPEVLETEITPGTGSPYAIDTIAAPYDNPWQSLLFFAGNDFLPDGRAVLCTMQGDVWLVDGLDADPNQPAKARWRRFASGLHHSLGLVVRDGAIFVQCRDQLTRLHDLNNDGVADFYECFSNAFQTSAAGHDFICGLEMDAQGRFYMASGNQGIVRIAADGSQAEVLATGFRNPDGLGLLPDGTVTVPCSEGSWTPASQICAFQPQTGPDGKLINRPHFGYGGPRNGQTPDLPLCYVPRALDNSSGGQLFVDSDRWGPLQGQLLHFSNGMGNYFLILRDEVAGQRQGAVVPMPGDFLSGPHRGRFWPRDGQLYATGMNGWGSYTPMEGCFQRVRYTGATVQLPADFHVYENGVTVTFLQPIDPSVAEAVPNQFAQCWNYRFGPGYGSPELAPTQTNTPGHEPVTIASAKVLADGKTLFLEMPELQPVNQLHLRLYVNAVNGGADNVANGHDLFLTVHRLDKPFTDFPGYKPLVKTVAPHPILADLTYLSKRVPNPFQKRLEPARDIRIETAGNLNFATREIRVKAGEPIRFTLANPDVVPHNWALVKPNTLPTVGELANQLIADPDAVARQYIPQSTDILAYTDVVLPNESFSIYLQAPTEPGAYPYLCTFPGHWMVMNGVMIVEPTEKLAAQ